jgi:trehalose 6-phosphate synthase/phosphatase
LRARIPDAAIGFFLHSPFPSSEMFRCLPRREAILDGLLGADLCCFQTWSYGRHFLSSAIRVMGYETSHEGHVDHRGGVTQVVHCPIGIDAKRIEADRTKPGVQPNIAPLRELYKDKKIIVGRDKLDPTKGIIPKLQAFERLLEDYPQWMGNTVLILVTSPSPTDSSQLATRVSELVDHINVSRPSFSLGGRKT